MWLHCQSRTLSWLKESCLFGSGGHSSGPEFTYDNLQIVLAGNKLSLLSTKLLSIILNSNDVPKVSKKEWGVCWLLITSIRQLARVIHKTPRLGYCPKTIRADYSCLLPLLLSSHCTSGSFLRAAVATWKGMPLLEPWLIKYFLPWLKSPHPWDPPLSPNSPFPVALLGFLMVWSSVIRKLVPSYDCQVLVLREAIFNFVLIKQLAQGTDVECMVFVHCLLVGPLNLGDWQRFPNYGEGGDKHQNPCPNSPYPSLTGTT